MNLVDSAEIYCPYCGEQNEIFIDQTAGNSQEFYEDCEICCRPSLVKIRIEHGIPAVTVTRSE